MKAICTILRTNHWAVCAGDFYNVYGSYIYYQRYDKNGSALCVIKNDGTEFQIIREGDFCDIHVTSYYVFFREYYSGEIYYCPRNDISNVSLFRPGTEAK